jgi:two-component system KDP operon response regulator KdpE
MTARDLTVLVIEDEAPMRRLLRASLPCHGYSVVEAPTGREGVANAGSNNPDIILLDLGLPDADGLEITRRIREFTRTPIIVVSARGKEQDKVAVLDAGADDYLTKPFSINELLARLRVARRHSEDRASEADEPVFVVGPLRMDLVKRRVLLNDKEVHLTPIEYRLLSALMRNAGRVMTQQELLKEGWGARYGTQSQYLHVYMGHLREKIEEEPARPKLLVTECGVGYRLRDASPD